MAIILDTNCFSRVFNESDKEHKHFVPVLDWIVNGHGFLVYGGSKYKNELMLCKRYLRVFNILKSMNKVVHFKAKDQKIDEITKNLHDLYGNEDFDDPHLPAIALVTKCKLICSIDVRSMSYVKDRKMYPKRFEVPIYYTSEKDKGLLTDQNIDERLLKYRRILNKDLKCEFKDLIHKFDMRK